MGRLFSEYLNGPTIWACKECGMHLANDQNLMSKSFRGDTGPAFLFNKTHNLAAGKTESEELMTGTHVITYKHCIGCYKKMGWEYKAAESVDQRYKVGMTVLETTYLVKKGGNNIANVMGSDMPANHPNFPFGLEDSDSEDSDDDDDDEEEDNEEEGNEEENEEENEELDTLEHVPFPSWFYPSQE